MSVHFLDTVPIWVLYLGLGLLFWAAVFLLVIDLDRPASGLFFVDQEAMVQLRESIQHDMAGDEVENAASGARLELALP